MLPTVLALFILWMIYLWLNRRQLLQAALYKPAPTKKSVPIYKPPSNPKFINSRPRSEASQVPPKTASPHHEHQPLTNQPTIDFAAIQRAAAQQRARLQTASPQIQNQLYRLTHGDRAMANRLIEYTRGKHPEQSEQWIWEKAVRDLERDRGCR